MKKLSKSELSMLKQYLMDVHGQIREKSVLVKRMTQEIVDLQYKEKEINSVIDKYK